MVDQQVALLALPLGVERTLRVRAEPGALGPAELVVTVVAHVLGVVGLVEVRAGRHFLPLSGVFCVGLPIW